MEERVYKSYIFDDSDSRVERHSIYLDLGGENYWEIVASRKRFFDESFRFFSEGLGEFPKNREADSIEHIGRDSLINLLGLIHMVIKGNEESNLIEIGIDNPNDGGLSDVVLSDSNLTYNDKTLDRLSYDVIFLDRLSHENFDNACEHAFGFIDR